MSGCGRKHRAKHLTRQFLDTSAWTGPSHDECMAVCAEPPQGQHLRVLLCEPHPIHNNNNESNASANDCVRMDNGMCLVERLVLFPGKFRKVIWLGVKDVVVIADRTTVTFKPSPEQLKRFYRTDPQWQSWLTAAQQRVEVRRRAAEQQPAYMRTAHNTTSNTNTNTTTTTTTTTTTDDGIVITNATTTSVLPTVSGDTRTEDEMPLNPNRNNIKHRQQFFYGDDDDDECEEEEEDNDDDSVEEGKIGGVGEDCIVGSQ